MEDLFICSYEVPGITGGNGPKRVEENSHLVEEDNLNEEYGSGSYFVRMDWLMENHPSLGDLS